MGLAGGLVLVKQGGVKPWTDTPKHDPAQATRIANTVGGGVYESVKMTTLEDAFHSSMGANALAIGAYGESAIIASWEIAQQLMTEGDSPTPWRWFSDLFPGGRMMTMAVISEMNFYSYAWFEGGEVQRICTGSHEDGVVLDLGDPRPEEEPFLLNSRVRDGARIFFDPTRPDDELTHDQVGEEIACALTQPFFGAPLFQHVDHLTFPMEQFARTTTKYPTLRRRPRHRR